MTAWRERIDVPVGERARWDFGTRLLWAERQPGQWLLGGPEAIGEEPVDPTFEIVSADRAPDADGPAVRRVAMAGESRSIQLVPRPPPRALIARPELPLVVPSGQAATIYIGVPLWIGAFDGETLLHEVPAVPLSDTWFGTPTVGELCYATRTTLRMALREIPKVTHRATCVLDVRNEHVEPLVLERLRLPATSLAIYLDDDGRLWTSPVRLRRDKSDKSEEVTEVVTRPVPAGRREIGAAREPFGAPLLGRVFNAVWVAGGGG